MNNCDGSVVIPGAGYFDLVPSTGDAPYRIFLSVPAESPPAQGWPLLVLTDGNATFPFAVSSLVTQAPYPNATNVGWGVVAAIGYPTDEAYDGMRRSWDLVPPPGRAYPPYNEGGPEIRTGGADKLLHFIEADLLPEIARRAPVDAGRRALFGHSFGGLFTLFALFERPDLFRNWIAASPSISWEDSQLLEREARRTHGSGGFVHLSAGEYEGDELAPFQYHNEDAAERLENNKLERTVDLAREMAERLDGTPDGLRARFELLPGETHMSVLAAVVNRAVSIAFAIRD
ncbi:esterase [Rhizobium sp. Root708]|uniref:alpha/beta hydrolase n=1 Tax=Rhizobium sp. Root708 TaxID=1736592 RepID=UPI000701F1D3|nr:alpha/beta hydrolase-fold protein [Rhizobium sp. Root708]KRB62042.1 esterase [Rhizobium sp. Root708]